MNVGVDLLSVLIGDYEINAEWLLTGNGSMLKSEQDQSSAGPANDKYVAMLEENNELLKKNNCSLEKINTLQEEKITKLEAEIQALKSAQSKSVNKSSQPSQSQPLIQPSR
ncbi:hypothetical protein AB4865_10620 [Capnocytophaga sp. ARDL2]|uniref:hypothetical protein n=1 Tax=Capnocytophaga sp. ARDL2 TaxID=3238809 RepID=UPI00355836A1